MLTEENGWTIKKKNQNKDFEILNNMNIPVTVFWYVTWILEFTMDLPPGGFG